MGRLLSGASSNAPARFIKFIEGNAYLVGFGTQGITIGNSGAIDPSYRYYSVANCAGDAYRAIDGSTLPMPTLVENNGGQVRDNQSDSTTIYYVRPPHETLTMASYSYVSGQSIICNNMSITRVFGLEGETLLSVSAPLSVCPESS